MLDLEKKFPVYHDDIFFEHLPKPKSCSNPLWDRPAIDVIETPVDDFTYEYTEQEYHKYSGRIPVKKTLRLA